MRTETYTVTKTYYTFDELSENAKEHAKNEYLFETDLRNEDLQANYDCDFFYWFPNSELKYQYSLSSCQGDGFNTYGKAAVSDIVKCVNEWGWKNPFTDKEWKTLMFYDRECDGMVRLDYNDRYYYSVAEYINITDFAVDCLEYTNGYRDIKKELLSRFESFCREFFYRFDKWMEKTGYDFLLEISDDDFREMANCNGWEFDVDGCLQ